MNFPIHIIWLSPFLFLGESEINFCFYSRDFFDEMHIYKQTVWLKMRCHALQCLILGHSVSVCSIYTMLGLYGLRCSVNILEE